MPIQVLIKRMETAEQTEGQVFPYCAQTILAPTIKHSVQSTKLFSLLIPRSTGVNELTRSLTFIFISLVITITILELKIHILILYFFELYIPGSSHLEDKSVFSALT